ncbi:MAG: hypothetical protein ACLFOY_19370 [Desulfatibacillaceae bacterium]
MFKQELCDCCGECLAACRFIDFDTESGARAMRDLVAGGHPEWLNQCVTCYACTEACDRGADPFALLCRRMEESGAYFDPESVKMVHAHFSPKGEYTPPEVSGRAFATCTIHSVMPGSIEGRLFDNAEILRGRHYFCNVLYTHMGNWSLYADAVRDVVDRLARTGADEIVFVHDDCWAMIAEARDNGVDIPFRATHILEYLAQYLREHAEDVTPLDVDVAYQRPCASRYSPEKEPLVDEILDLVGARRLAREFDRENALCCLQNTGDMLPARKGMDHWRDKNVTDADEHGARAMVFLCPMCREALGEKCREAGLATVMISDLARMAMGEIPAPWSE